MDERRIPGTWLSVAVAACALLVAACSDPDETISADTGSAGAATVSTPPPSAPDSSSSSVVADGSVVAGFAGATWFLGRVPARAVRADVSLEPIRLGMVNQEDTPVGSYPELRAAAEAAVAWVNAELGGVDRRPIELHTCLTPFDAERSRSCAQELVDSGVVAFVGGVDVLSEGAIDVLEQNGLSSFGGVPANLDEQQSPNVFFFSGGDAGALAGFMAHAREMGASDVAVAYGSEVESFAVAARDYGVRVGRSLGMQVELIPFSMFGDDFEFVMREAQRVDADAVIVLAATSACVPTVEAAAVSGLEAQLYLTGACFSEETIRSVERSGVAVVWNAEGPVDGIDVDASLYRAVVDRYATEPAGGAGTVGFRGFMNLYALLLEVGGDDVSAGALAELARAAVDRPSFWGHPYTCDGRQVPGLPALCAPQQILFTVGSDGEIASVTGWIPTDELLSSSVD